MQRPTTRRIRALLLAAALAAAPSMAERFVALGTQPDGATLYVQASPPTTLPDGRRRGWFRTVATAPQAVTDEHGVVQEYQEMLGLNVADCKARRMGSASLTYRDGKGVVVARFELPAAQVELVAVRPNTAGEAMLGWLCAPKKAALPAPAEAASPFK